jgi:hypothetical protein
VHVWSEPSGTRVAAPLASPLTTPTRSWEVIKAEEEHGERKETKQRNGILYKAVQRPYATPAGRGWGYRVMSWSLPPQPDEASTPA